MNDTQSRVAGLRESMAQAGLQALLITEPHNRRYLTGFTGSAGLLLVLPDSLPFLVAARHPAKCRAREVGQTAQATDEGTSPSE